MGYIGTPSNLPPSGGRRICEKFSVIGPLRLFRFHKAVTILAHYRSRQLDAKFLSVKNKAKSTWAAKFLFFITDEVFVGSLFRARECVPWSYDRLRRSSRRPKFWGLEVTALPPRDVTRGTLGQGRAGYIGTAGWVFQCAPWAFFGKLLCILMILNPLYDVFFSENALKEIWRTETWQLWQLSQTFFLMQKNAILFLFYLFCYCIWWKITI